MAGGGGAVKTALRILFALALIAALVCYIIEFVEDQRTDTLWHNLVDVFKNHHGHPGYIVLFVLILVFLILGAVGVGTENLIVMVIFVIGMLVLVIIDAIYVGWLGGIIAGSLAVGFGAFFTIALMVGGGK